MPISVNQHNTEIHSNLACLNKKPILIQIYKDFHQLIKEQLANVHGEILEIGSGIGLIKETIPTCICSDIFSNPWIDRKENAYQLSCNNDSVSNLILIDVFHHLRYPGTALNEWRRVLKPDGHIILLEPCISILGRVIYGLCHHEPLALKDPINWKADENWLPTDIDYYAAQSNAYRIFFKSKLHHGIEELDLISCDRISSLSYVASGGFSKPQMYPTRFYPAMRLIDRILSRLPSLFATRMLVVLRKKQLHHNH